MKWHVSSEHYVLIMEKFLTLYKVIPFQSSKLLQMLDYWIIMLVCYMYKLFLKYTLFLRYRALQFFFNQVFSHIPYVSKHIPIKFGTCSIATEIYEKNSFRKSWSFNISSMYPNLFVHHHWTLLLVERNSPFCFLIQKHSDYIRYRILNEFDIIQNVSNTMNNF